MRHSRVAAESYHRDDPFAIPSVYPDPLVAVRRVETFLNRYEAAFRAGTVLQKSPLYKEASSLYRNLNVAAKHLVGWHHFYGTVAHDLFSISSLLERLSSLIDPSSLVTRRLVSRAGTLRVNEDHEEEPARGARIHGYLAQRYEKRRLINGNSGPKSDGVGKLSALLDVLHVRFTVAGRESPGALGWVVPSFAQRAYEQLVKSDPALALSHLWRGHEVHAEALAASTIGLRALSPDMGSLTFVTWSNLKPPAPHFFNSVDHSSAPQVDPSSHDFHAHLRNYRRVFEEWIDKELAEDPARLPKVLRGARPRC